LKRIIFILYFILLCLQGAKNRQYYVNLYTDSLKKGTYNYINIDGLLPDGSYIPLDSTHLIFTASAGKFYGNNLLLDKNFAEEKVSIKVVLRQNPSVPKAL
jgi:hypothetical protein